ncbi:MAG: hypothetical protein EOP49_08675, partial [Sphingobacteriales bacterium]
KKETEARLDAVFEAEQKERQRLASELHDSVCGDLNAVRYMITHQVKQGVPCSVEVLQSINASVAVALESTRHVSHNLMPPMLSEFGLKTVLEENFEVLSRNTATSFQLESCRLDLSESVSYHLLRVIQELVANALRYGTPSYFRLFIADMPPYYVFDIKEDGAAFDFELSTKASAGIGLKNITSRLNSIGGTIRQLPCSVGNHFIIKISLDNA